MKGLKVVIAASVFIGLGLAAIGILSTPGPTEVQAQTTHLNAFCSALENMNLPTAKAQAVDAYCAKTSSLPMSTTNTKEPPPIASGAVQVHLLGITTGMQPLGAPMFVASNAWLGTSSIVYAGYSMDNPAQGVVLVYSRGGMPIQQGAYTTPTLDGSLTITSANGQVLTLSAKDGATYQFNVATQSLTRESGN